MTWMMACKGIAMMGLQPRARRVRGSRRCGLLRRSASALAGHTSTKTNAGLVAVVAVGSLILAGCGGTTGSVPSSTASPAISQGVVGVSCATGGGAANTCVVGATGPGGGPVFYVKEANLTGSRYLEAAPSGWNGVVDPWLAWSVRKGFPSCFNLDVTGTSQAIGTGLANTNRIRAKCDSAAKAPAAWAVYNYSNGAANSWYLPSQLELNQECRYASGQAFDASATTCTGSVAPVGGFAAGYYWSSSQVDPTDAWGQGLVDGLQFNDSKFNILRVRPVRAF